MMPPRSIEAIAGDLVLALQNDSLTWPKRLHSYSWGSSRAKKIGAKETLMNLDSLKAPMMNIFQQIKDGKTTSHDDRENLTRFAQDVFKWGGVTRSNSERARDGAIVENVIKAALSWHVSNPRPPMNSGWTKVAALSSEFVEIEGGLPQVIFDSRVAASLLTHLDDILDCVPDGSRPASFLPEPLARLGYVPSRGAKARGRRNHRIGWPNGYRNWESQFAASRLVNAIRDNLNKNLMKYGKMPFSPYPDGRWSTRGVEMVLFMDGK